MISLFIGRFQPFHNGHLFDIKNATQFSDSLVIGIGSADKSDVPQNPFNFEERKQMIEIALKENKITNYRIFAIPDIHDDEKWVAHVCSIVPKFDVVYTGNHKVKKLFEEKGYSVKDVTLLPKINATEVRKRISNGELWKSMVPKEIADFIVKNKLLNKVKIKMD